MDYPQWFRDRALKLYPDWPKLHYAIAEGNVFVGRYLDDASIGVEALSVDHILSAQSLEELQIEARKLRERRDLYSDWCTLYEEQRRR